MAHCILIGCHGFHLDINMSFSATTIAALPLDAFRSLDFITLQGLQKFTALSQFKMCDDFFWDIIITMLNCSLDLHSFFVEYSCQENDFR